MRHCWFFFHKYGPSSPVRDDGGNLVWIPFGSGQEQQLAMQQTCRRCGKVEYW